VVTDMYTDKMTGYCLRGNDKPSYVELTL